VARDAILDVQIAVISERTDYADTL